MKIKIPRQKSAQDLLDKTSLTPREKLTSLARTSFQKFKASKSIRDKISDADFKSLNKNSVKATRKRSNAVKNLLSAINSPIQNRVYRKTPKYTKPTGSNLNWRDASQEHLAQRQKDLDDARLMNQKISSSTQEILERLRNTQTLGQRNRMQMERIHRERKIIAASSNLLKTPSLFGPDSNTFRPLERDEFDILSAPNVFKENDDTNIMKTRRPSILATKEAGNNLKFF